MDSHNVIPLQLRRVPLSQQDSPLPAGDPSDVIQTYNHMLTQYERQKHLLLGTLILRAWVHRSLRSGNQQRQPGDQDREALQERLLAKAGQYMRSLEIQRAVILTYQRQMRSLLPLSLLPLELQQETLLQHPLLFLVRPLAQRIPPPQQRVLRLYQMYGLSRCDSRQRNQQSPLFLKGPLPNQNRSL